MAEMYKVTERVLVDHPDGYQVLVAVPGDEIPMQQAVKWRLVKRPRKAAAARRSRNAADKGDADKVVTAEVRREQRPDTQPTGDD